MRLVFNMAFSMGYTAYMSHRVIATAMFQRDDARHRVPQLALQWAQTMCEQCGVTVRTHGADTIDFGQPMVVVANHQSLFDVPVLMIAGSKPFSFVAKKELFEFPVFGRALPLVGCVPIDRTDRTNAAKSLDSAARHVREGHPLVMFPEGTRSSDGRLLPFRKGAFFLAQKARVPVLPVGIVGTRQVLPRDKLLVSPGVVEVLFGKPIVCADDSEEARDQLRADVRNAIGAMTGYGVA